MKITIKKSASRGTTRNQWLDSRHSFSFGEYYEPKNTNFRELIVFNEDWIAPGKGFGMHHHDNAEVVSIVLEGELMHEDSTGNKGVIKHGEVQRMSAGTGIMHSEHASIDGQVHLLQIWLKPRTKNTKPSYEQKKIEIKEDKLTRIVSAKGKDSVYINQDSEFLIGKFSDKKRIEHLTTYNNAYLFVIKGKVSIEKNMLAEGDAAEISGTKKIIIRTEKGSEILIIEMK